MTAERVRILNISLLAYDFEKIWVDDISVFLPQLFLFIWKKVNLRDMYVLLSRLSEAAPPQHGCFPPAAEPGPPHLWSYFFFLCFTDMIIFYQYLSLWFLQSMFLFNPFKCSLKGQLYCMFRGGPRTIHVAIQNIEI